MANDPRCSALRTQLHMLDLDRVAAADGIKVRGYGDAACRGYCVRAVAPAIALDPTC